MNSETITEYAFKQQIGVVENLRVKMDAAPLGAENEDEMVNYYADTRDSLMGTPAPYFVSARWKLDRLEEQVRDGLIVQDDVEAFIADIRRLCSN